MARFAVIGLGRFGTKLAATLEARGAEVLAIDNSEDRVQAVKDTVTSAICMDTTDERALRAAGLPDVEAAIICIGENFEANILTTALLKRIGVPKVIARTSQAIQSQILELVGADRIVFPEEEIAYRLGQSLVIASLLDVLPISERHSYAEVKAPRVFWEKSLQDIAPRAKYGVNIVAIKYLREGRDKPTVDSVPGPETVIHEGDILLVVGKLEDIERLAKT